MQRPCTPGAAPLASLGGELRVNLGEKAEKRRIVQNADVHWLSLSGVVTGDCVTRMGAATDRAFNAVVADEGGPLGVRVQKLAPNQAVLL